MKSNLLLCAQLPLQALTGFAQKTSRIIASADAIAAFEKTFPGASKVKWSKEKKIMK
jgi:hypothetical protein